MLTLFPDYRRSQLPIENQFFIQFFWKMLLPQSKIKFFSLWKMIRDRSLGVDDQHEYVIHLTKSSLFRSTSANPITLKIDDDGPGPTILCARKPHPE